MNAVGNHILNVCYIYKKIKPHKENSYFFLYALCLQDVKALSFHHMAKMVYVLKTLLLLTNRENAAFFNLRLDIAVTNDISYFFSVLMVFFNLSLVIKGRLNLIDYDLYP